MFTQIRPQKVVDPEQGFMVQTIDCYAAEYVEPARSVLVEIENDSIVSIYRASVVNWRTDAGETRMSSEDIEMVVARVEVAIRFMGARTEIC